MRAADTDRERVVEALRRHAGEGRLDVEELEQRIDAALAARTLEELEALLHDLPHERSKERRRRARSPEWQVYAGVSALLVGIWALSGMGYFWPAWPILGWGFFMLMPGCGHAKRHRAERHRSRSAGRFA